MYLLTVLTVTDLTWPDFISNKSATLVWHSFEWCVLAAVVSSNGWPLTPLWVGSRLLQQHAMQWVQCNASGVTQTVIDSRTGQKRSTGQTAWLAQIHRSLEPWGMRNRMMPEPSKSHSLDPRLKRAALLGSVSWSCLAWFVKSLRPIFSQISFNFNFLENQRAKNLCCDLSNLVSRTCIWNGIESSSKLMP